jgi:TolB-like protein/class 3 adenylate cyclase/tetratricopeptide (TPR) repeat protein
LANDRVERRLAAIVAADVVGYSRLMGLDEVGTARTLREHRSVTDALVTKHGGRLVKSTGDGVLLEFSSVVDAVECAVAVQAMMAERNESIPQDRRMLLRIGINLGDILIEGDDILGDGVNVAARLEGIAEPGGICISSSAHDQVRGKIAIEFADLGEKSLKNIARPVRVYTVVRNRIGEAGARSDPPLPWEDLKAPSLPNKPSIAVLPFQNMSGDPEQEYFADGMVEDIITALSSFKSLFVIARNSSFTYKGKAVDIKQVGRDLGVRYVLEGSVRRAGGRVRITAQLIDAVTGAHLWADKFDRSLEDVFDVQDQVTAAVVGVVDPKIQLIEIERAKQKPTDSLDSYDLFLRGLALIHKYDFSDTTRKFFQKAYALDPGYAAAYGMEAFAILNQQATFGQRLPAETCAEALRLAELAADLANDDALALARAAHVFAYFGREFDRATFMADRAVGLNPNFSGAWHARGWIAIMCCEPDRAIESFDLSSRFNPRDRSRITSWMGNSYALWLQGRYDDGCAVATKAIQFSPSVLSLGAYIANASSAGYHGQAREAVKRLRSIAPDYRVSDAYETGRFRDPNLLDKFAGCLREAGLPEN